MNLHKMSLIYIDQISGVWFIIGKGHYYNPEGVVYLWPDGSWSSMPNCYESRITAENKLAEMGYTIGSQR